LIIYVAGPIVSLIAKSEQPAEDTGMGAHSSHTETVVKTKNRGQCMEYRLVLDAVGIPSRSYHEGGWWWLDVNHQDAERAFGELDAYRRENPDVDVESAAQPTTYRFAVAGVVAYVIVLVSIAILNAYQAYGIDWYNVGKMHSGSIQQGQWWRAVTALTLHLELGHLMSNLVFGVVFGLLVGRTYGGGVAWLATVVAGTLGNALNAWIQDADHTSIGASTAVFGALGLMVAHALRHWSDRSSRWTRWRPLIAGLVLLAFTGVGGERTDVAAHVTGFLAGLAIGWLTSLASPERLSSTKLQQVTGAIAIAIVVIAWATGAVSAAMD
jgi:rhomboid protease GluP